MLKRRFFENLNARVTFWPYPIRLVIGSEGAQTLPPFDFHWHVTAVVCWQFLQLQNIHTGHLLRLYADLVHGTDPAPEREHDGYKHLVAILKAPLYIDRWGVGFGPQFSAQELRRLKGRS